MLNWTHKRQYLFVDTLILNKHYSFSGFVALLFVCTQHNLEICLSIEYCISEKVWWKCSSSTLPCHLNLKISGLRFIHGGIWKVRGLFYGAKQLKLPSTYTYYVYTICDRTNYIRRPTDVHILHNPQVVCVQ